MADSTELDPNVDASTSLCEICYSADANCRLPCTHTLCSSCLHHLVKPECPYCRKALDTIPDEVYARHLTTKLRDEARDAVMAYYLSIYPSTPIDSLYTALERYDDPWMLITLPPHRLLPPARRPRRPPVASIAEAVISLTPLLTTAFEQGHALYTLPAPTPMATIEGLSIAIPSSPPSQARPAPSTRASTRRRQRRTLATASLSPLVSIDETGAAATASSYSEAASAQTESSHSDHPTVFPSSSNGSEIDADPPFRTPNSRGARRRRTPGRGGGFITHRAGVNDASAASDDLLPASAASVSALTVSDPLSEDGGGCGDVNSIERSIPE
jgi:hypothetical protein